jgi:hypothetical protein
MTTLMCLASKEEAAAMLMGEREGAINTTTRKVEGIKAMAAKRENTMEEVVTSKTDTTLLPSILNYRKVRSPNLRPYEPHKEAMKPTQKKLGRRQPSYSQGLVS